MFSPASGSPNSLVTVLSGRITTAAWALPELTRENTMTRPVDLSAAGTAALTLKARYEIEAGFDYLYVQASTDGGTTWTSLDGTAAGEPFVRTASDQPAISGSSGGEWVDVNVPLDAYAGQAIELSFLYDTDGGVAPDGSFADDVSVVADGAPLFTSGAEEGDEGWTLDGFRATTGTETGVFDNYYIASHRSFVSYDRYLTTGPYNFGFLNTRPDWVEHFSRDCSSRTGTRRTGTTTPASTRARARSW
jgi:immune inhibitor A